MQHKEPFKAVKKPLHDQHDEGGHGESEMGWLVSYADMMTLLFGLFVVLYSLSQDKTKDVEQVMKGISNNYFSAPSSPTETTTEAPTTEEPVTEKTVPVEEVEKIKQEMVTEKEKSEKEIEKLKTEVEELKREKTVSQDDNKRLQRAVASNSESTQDQSQKIEEMSEQLTQSQQQNESLKQELENQKNKSPSQNYMMVVLTWETEKHDVDLKVLTPNKKSFDFKHRKFKGEEGSFELDSRYGPGMEMWKAVNFTPGRYQAQLNLYNKNGNVQDAPAQITVVTNSGTYKSAPVTLSDAQKNGLIEFEIKKDGSVEFK